MWWGLRVSQQFFHACIGSGFFQWFDSSQCGFPKQYWFCSRPVANSNQSFIRVSSFGWHKVEFSGESPLKKSIILFQTETKKLLGGMEEVSPWPVRWFCPMACKSMNYLPTASIISLLAITHGSLDIILQQSIPPPLSLHKLMVCPHRILWWTREWIWRKCIVFFWVFFLLWKIPVSQTQFAHLFFRNNNF